MQHPRYGGDSAWKVQREKEVHGEGVTEPTWETVPPTRGKQEFCVMSVFCWICRSQEGVHLGPSTPRLAYRACVLYRWLCSKGALADSLINQDFGTMLTECSRGF